LVAAIFWCGAEVQYPHAWLAPVPAVDRPEPTATADRFRSLLSGCSLSAAENFLRLHPQPHHPRWYVRVKLRIPPPRSRTPAPPRRLPPPRPAPYARSGRQSTRSHNINAVEAAAARRPRRHARRIGGGSADAIRSRRERGDPGASGRAAIVARARGPAISDPARDRSINQARVHAPPPRARRRRLRRCRCYRCWRWSVRAGGRRADAAHRVLIIHT
jgi:hypothetical protein